MDPGSDAQQFWLSDAPKRQAIATRVLQSIGALPEDV